MSKVTYNEVLFLQSWSLRLFEKVLAFFYILDLKHLVGHVCVECTSSAVVRLYLKFCG